MLCMCIDSGTSLCSACSNITSACYGQTWSVYLFQYPYRSFLIEHELHTSTKLTLQSCFCNISYCASLFVFQFLYPPSTSVFALNCSFSLTHAHAHSLSLLLTLSVSLSVSWFSLEAISTSPLLSERCPLGTLSAVVMFTHTTDKLFRLIL